jgi:RNase P subunit RPR2
MTVHCYECGKALSTVDEARWTLRGGEPRTQILTCLACSCRYSGDTWTPTELPDTNQRTADEEIQL